MLALNQQLATQYHACVPLGWAPVASAGTYYIGYSAQIPDQNTLWVGEIDRKDLRRRDVRDVVRVLTELVRVGMLTSERDKTSYHYYLTPTAMRYYYGGDQYGNNPEHYPYLCYSIISPQRIAYKSAIHHEGSSESFRVGFTWEPRPIAPWSNDAVLIRHSVTLQPYDTTIPARFVGGSKAWEIQILGSDDTNRFPRINRYDEWDEPSTCLCRHQCIGST